jgi:uncharacterized protein
MDTLTEFIIPISGLKEGEHQYSWKLEKNFFSSFEGSLIEDGLLEVELILSKHHDFYELEFEIFGSVQKNCDRCLASIPIPVEANERLLVKLTETVKDDEGDIVYISPHETSFQVAPYLYEFVHLNLPLTNILEGCDLLDPKPCDMEVLKFVSNEDNSKPASDEDNPFLKAFKDLENLN